MRNSEDEMNDNNEAAKSLANKAAFLASIAIITLMSQAMHWVESKSKKLNSFHLQHRNNINLLTHDFSSIN